MASLTVRNVPEEAKHRFRQVAAAHGRSMEEHLRQLVLAAVEADTAVPGRVAEAVRPFGHFQPDAAAASRSAIERLIELGRGLDFEPPPRTAEKYDPPDFS